MKNETLPESAERERSIGALLIDGGKLSPADAERVLRHQRLTGLRFGEAALQLGVVAEADIRQALSRQFDYPCLLPGDPRVAAEVVAAFEPHGTVVEQLRALRSQLLLRWFDRPERRALAVVGSQRGEGRSFMAANLAVVFSQLGERTLLVDADLRHPRQHKLFGCDDRQGLAALLAGRELPEVAQRVPGLLGLSVLPAGPTPPNPQELLTRAFTPRLLDWARSHYDVVIVDTAAARPCADALTVAAQAGGALLLAQRHASEVADTRRLVDQLRAAGATPVGAVMNEY